LALAGKRRAQAWPRKNRLVNWVNLNGVCTEL